MRALLPLLLLLACGDKEGDTADEGGPGGSGSGSGNPPAVGEGELAVDVYDSLSADPYAIRCSAADASTTLYAYLQPIAAGAGAEVLLYVACGYSPSGDSAQDLRGVLLAVTEDTLEPGTYPIFPDVTVATHDAFSFHVIDGGEGFSLPDTMNGGITFDGELTVEENGGSGGAFKATFAIDYPLATVVTGGVSTEVQERPGTAIGAMHVILP